MKKKMKAGYCTQREKSHRESSWYPYQPGRSLTQKYPLLLFFHGLPVLVAAAGPCHCRTQTDGCVCLSLCQGPRTQRRPVSGTLGGAREGCRVECGGWGGQGLKMHEWPYAQGEPGRGGPEISLRRVRNETSSWTE